MNKKTILFIGLIISFLIILVYIEKTEQQKQIELRQAEISETKKEIDWDNITPEYFLGEDVLDADLFTTTREIESKGDDNVKTILVRDWYNEQDGLIIGVLISEHKDKFPESVLRDENEINVVNKMSEETVMTYLGSFTFKDQIVENNKFETKQEHGIDTSFYLMWNKDRFSFSVKIFEKQYQEQAKEIAKNIISKYTE